MIAAMRQVMIASQVMRLLRSRDGVLKTIEAVRRRSHNCGFAASKL
jgi:hypothetical protein